MHLLITRYLQTLKNITNQPTRTRLILGVPLLLNLLVVGFEADELFSPLVSQYRLLIFVCQLIAVAIAGTLFWFVRGRSPNSVLPSIASTQIRNEFTTLELVVGLTVVGLAAYQRDVVFGQWAVLVFLFPCFLIIPLLAKFGDQRLKNAGSQPVGYIAVTIACALGLVIIFDLGENLFRLDGAIVATIALIASFPVVKNPLLADLRSSAYRLLAFFSTFVFAIIFFAAIFALRSLQNFERILGNFESLPILTAFVTAFFACAARELCVQITSQSVPQAFDQGTRAWFSYLLDLMPYAVILMFALRADSLFVEGSELHWEYFVGPVRTVRSGGWLLWDTPSQYGFLNILLAALIPLRSAWDCFYLFQAATLFVAASLFYRFLHHYSRAGRAVSLTLVVTGVFLAYPILIGPAPFPSSSAVRFLWCYVLLYFAASIFLRPDPSMRTFVRRGTILWLAAVLWSAESAIYATSIFFAPIFLQLVLRFLSDGPVILIKRENWSLIALPLSMLALVLLGISAFYFAKIGHAPDFEMFWMYGFAYASGFGSIPINWDGPIWVFVLVFFAATAGLRVALTDRLAAEGPAGALVGVMACVWATASYYVGRAVPNNVVALFPLICFILAVTLRATASSNRISLGAVAVALPIFSLAMAAPVWNEQLFGVVKGLRPYPQKVESRLHSPSVSLALLLTRAGIDLESRVAYFGYAGAMPGETTGQAVRSYEGTWLPTPLTLLENPIPPSRRSLIVGRFLSRTPRSGYFVYANGEFGGAQDWVELLSKTHEAEFRYKQDQYEAIYFKPKAGSAQNSNAIK